MKCGNLIIILLPTPDNWVGNQYVRDDFMEVVLNREPVFDRITSIVHYKKQAYSLVFPYKGNCRTGSGVASGSCNCSSWTVHKHGSHFCSIDETPSLTKYEYSDFGQVYKDYIYANLCNDFVKDGYPDHSPFLAGCFYFYDVTVCDMDYPTLLYEDFFLEWIAIFVSPYDPRICNAHEILYAGAPAYIEIPVHIEY